MRSRGCWRLFERYGIHCTWATVGFLFFDDKEELLQYLPQERPALRQSGALALSS